jgi:hypothetical protein
MREFLYRNPDMVRARDLVGIFTAASGTARSIAEHFCSSGESAGELRRDSILLRLYSEAIQVRIDDDKIFPGKGLMLDLGLWHAAELVYLNSSRFALFEWDRFIPFLRSTGCSRIPSLLDCRHSPTPELVTYEEFSSVPSRGIIFLIDSFVLHSDPSDPFAARQTVMTLEEYVSLHQSPRSLSDWVIDWWYTKSTPPEPTRVLEKFMNLIFESTMLTDLDSNPRYLSNLFLLALLGRKADMLDLLWYAPVLSRLPTAPSLVPGSSWRWLMAVEAARAKSFNIHQMIEKLANTAPTSLWDFDEGVDRRFGLLGCTDADLAEALMEVRYSGVELFVDVEADTEFVAKLVPLIRMFDDSAIPGVIESINAIGVFDTDSVHIAKQVLENFFYPLVKVWITRVVGPDPIDECHPPDESVMETIERLLTMATAAVSGEGVLFHEQSDEATDWVRRVARQYWIVKLGLVTRSVFPELETSDDSKTVRFIVDVAMRSVEGSRLGRTVAQKIGVESQFATMMIDELLVNGFDDDIEEYVEFGAEHILRHVTTRVSLCMHALGEDTSRMHGVINSVIPRKSIDRFLSWSDFSEKEKSVVREWLLGEGPQALLESCSRLLHNPSVIQRSPRSELDELVEVVEILQRLLESG